MSKETSHNGWSDDERRILSAHFTDLEDDVFALVGLPEVVKGALFARYSRSPKSLRRLFLDEFVTADADDTDASEASESGDAGAMRAEKLYERVFVEYGDDSVAQLGGAHIAVEGASNVLTKVLEWGRLMSYLEQSTRYIPYTQRDTEGWRYATPLELDAHPELRTRYRQALDLAFETYAELLTPMAEHIGTRTPREAGTSETAHARAVKAKALDVLRGLLPAATRSNVGLYGSGQAYEALLLRMNAHPLVEVRDCAARMLVELRKVIPAFLTRVDREDRGVLWSRYLRQTREDTAVVAAELLTPRNSAPDGMPPDETLRNDTVTLTDFDPDGEVKVVAAALYAASGLPDAELLRRAYRMTDEERERVLRAYVGERHNRRHRPGRAFERTSYRFDVLTDYGAFRDLQRHRLLTLEWQALTSSHGYQVPAEVVDAGVEERWRRVMETCADVHAAIEAAGLPEVASYTVPMAYRIRFYMDMNAREAMHVIELRTTPQGHPSYRRVCQQMHQQIADVAGHHAIAAAMSYTDHSDVELERLEAEKKLEARRNSG